jgi:integrase
MKRFRGMVGQVHAEGWKLRLPPGHHTYTVRFRHKGKRVERSTGKSDATEAAVEAAQIYAAVVTGRTAARPIAAGFDQHVANYLVDYEMTHSKGTFETVTMYFSAHIIPFFGSFEAFTPTSYTDYVRTRIGQATRVTVRKELSALRLFVDWCGQHGMSLPAVPPLPKQGHPGVRAPNARKRKATIISEAEAKTILAAMPEKSRRTGAWVRPMFTVLWETGLRPTTVLKLEAPLHYTKGSRRLFISREIDKEQYERHVPLTVAARKALDRVCPEAGKLFDAHEDSLRASLEAALKACGLEPRRMSVYDFKHSRISIDANSGAPLAGVAHLVGHKHISTTALYVQTGKAAAQAALSARRSRHRQRAR